MEKRVKFNVSLLPLPSPDPSESPLIIPVAIRPVVKDEFYIHEVINWILFPNFKTYEHYKKVDITLRYNHYPPEQFYKPIVYSYNSLRQQDLQHYDPRDEKKLISPHCIFLNSILKAINTNFSKFFEICINILNLEKVLKNEDDYNKEISLISHLVTEIEKLLKKPITIPVLYHHREHGLLMSRELYSTDNLEEKITNDYYKFIFSIETSYNFFQKVKKILIRRSLLTNKIKAYSNSNPSFIELRKPSDIILENLPDDFEQISCQATEKQILIYFSVLYLEKNRLLEEPYLSKTNTELFVHNAFKIFGQKPMRMNIKLNIKKSRQKIIIRKFIYDFCEKYEFKKKDRHLKYAKLLKYHFAQFENDNLLSIVSNFSRTPRDVEDILFEEERKREKLKREEKKNKY